MIRNLPFFTISRSYQLYQIVPYQIETELELSSLSLYTTYIYSVYHATLFINSSQLTAYCHRKKEAPYKMGRGSATADHRFAYFTTESFMAIHRYEFSTGKWDQLPSSPYSNSALVIINGALTAVGGWTVSRYFNQLFTLRRGRWVEEYAPMNTALSHAAAVSTFDGNYVFVIGGLIRDGVWTDRVNMFHVRSNKWHSLRNLPLALPFPSATICGDQIYVIGGDAIGVGYSCSLRDLPSSDKPRRFNVRWTPLPSLLVSWSTAATLCGQLVIVGGYQGASEVDFIYQLVDREWVEIGALSGSRRKCLVVNSAPDKVLIVGGYRGFTILDTFEECVVY